MFEKEAEEYADKNSGTRSLPIHEAYARGLEEGFQDGAEFGYNKCKEEINQKGLALQSDMDKTIEQNIALKKGIVKVAERYGMISFHEWDKKFYFEKKI